MLKNCPQNVASTIFGHFSDIFCYSVAAFCLAENTEKENQGKMSEECRKNVRKLGSTPTSWSGPFRDHGLRPWSHSPSEHCKPYARRSLSLLFLPSSFPRALRPEGCHLYDIRERQHIRTGTMSSKTQVSKDGWPK